MKILIVDDDKVSSNFLLKILKSYGKCDIATDGIEAVDAFILAHEEGIPYDLVCLDLMLPFVDGEKVLAALRKIEIEKKIEPLEKVKVVITSALNDRELTSQLTKYGFDEYFIKPIEVERFLDFIKSF